MKQCAAHTQKTPKHYDIYKLVLLPLHKTETTGFWFLASILIDPILVGNKILRLKKRNKGLSLMFFLYLQFFLFNRLDGGWFYHKIYKHKKTELKNKKAEEQVRLFTTYIKMWI